MITFSKIGKKGNLGNQFFQIASTIGLAVQNNFEYVFLPWQYQQYFKNKLPSVSGLPTDVMILNETQYHHHSWDFKDKQANYDLIGWLQSEKYFDVEKTKHYFQFEDDFVRGIRDKYADAFQKKTILISIRRGDFVNHPDYLQVSIKYYLNALARFFPDWTSRNLIVLSDDIDYCKFHFSFLNNAYFGDGLNAIEQLCLGSLCDDFIIGNSTFSWWSAWLGEKENSRIIRPHQNFDGQKSLESDDKDYFPERWLSYNPSDEKIKLDDVSFELDFKNNKDIISAYLSHYFEVDIRYDSASSKDSKYHYIFKKDYIMPPILVYYSCLKKADSSKDSILNHVVKTFKVSKNLNYAAFSQQQDFGMFSSIFNFNRSISKEATQDIYIQNSGNKPSVDSNPFIINTTVGQFSKASYQYSFKRYLKKLEIMMKRNIKKLLFIKK